ncbi:glycosyltransferase family 4 protein [bacterium]|nr:glycosyltransferase family 4 protein [bacterium]
MRIGYVHSTDFPTVDANVVQVVQMCRAFAVHGHSVTLFIPRASAYPTDDVARTAAREMFGGELPFEIRFVPRVRLLGRLEVLGTVAGALKAIRQADLDLVYSRNPWTVLFLPRTGVPYVFEAHEERIHLRSRFLDSFLRSTIVKNSRKPSCALVVAISKALCGIWREFGVPEEKLLDAHDGVELELFHPSQSREDARRQLGIETTIPVVVYAGALKSDRGIDRMIRAAQELPEIEFYLAGGKENEIAHWKTESARIGVTNIHFPGRMPHREIPLWLAAADVLLMMWTWRVPTIRGCSPMKLFEYMAAGRLIVGPAFPTVCEVMDHGKEGILFEPDSQTGLIAALREAVTTLGDRTMPEAARKKVAENYTWRARTERILDALAERGIGKI